MRSALQRLEFALYVRSRGLPPPWGPLLRLLRYPAALVRDWLAGELNVRAMSLAYTTLLSIVPLIAFSFSILKGLGANAHLAEILEEFFRPMGGAAAQISRSVMQFVRNMRGDVLGSIGLAFLVYTVVATINKVESSFNFVWRIARPRSLARRFGEYLSAVIVGPVLLAAAFGVLASAHDSPLSRWLGTLLPLTWTFSLLGKALPYAVVTTAFTLMYALIPNTRVRWSAAVAGGLGAGALWALIGRIFTAFILYSSQLVAVYTSFAVVLATLIWVYLNWLVLLIGAQLSFYVQNPQYLHSGRMVAPLAGSAREQAAVAIMLLIGRDYARGEGHWSAGALADALDLPGSALAPVVAALERSGLLIATESATLLPARDVRKIGLAEIIDAVREPDAARAALQTRLPEAAAELSRRVEQALHEPLAGLSLNDLIGRD
ncbi:MAG: YihY family inner membrane protein [Gammaproteobacteria bacterium]|nr:YihY family inner membrane protein [Gammaproteobacteria bacterium]